MEIEEKKLITFYCKLDCEGTPKISDFNEVIKLNSIKYPCMILIRENNWNDYNYYSHFKAFYSEKEDYVNELGTVMIIQTNEPKTILPDQFEILDKKFFSQEEHCIFTMN